MVKDALTFAHFFGMGLSLSMTAVIGYNLAREIRGPMTATSVAIVEQLSVGVAVGLVLLWLSGIGFLVCYTLWTPEKLLNPKIAVKLCIVLELSVNGLWFIHRRVIPHLQDNIGRRLLGSLTPGKQASFLFSGALSAAGWLSALTLGAVGYFNHNWIASAGLFGGLLVIFTVLAAVFHTGTILAREAHDVRAGSLILKLDTSS